MLRQRIRGGLMFLVACFTSPCCTPLYVPLLLALLAGTPAAAWLAANQGWVYGGLTLVSLASLVVSVRWFMGKRERREHARRAEVTSAPRGALEEVAR